MIIETVDVTPPSAAGPRGASRLLGSSLLLVRRRAWRDRGFLLASTFVVALASMLALAGPKVVSDTLDDGAKDAVAAAGDRADIVISFPVGNTSGDNVNSVRGTAPAQFSSYAEQATGNLPGIISPLVEGYSSSVLSRALAVEEVLEPIPDSADITDPEDWDANLNPDLWTPRVETIVQFAMSDDLALTVVEGRLPVDATGSELPTEIVETIDGVEVRRLTVAGETIEVALTREVADALGVDIGDVLRVENAAENRTTLRVVGIVAPTDPSDPAWASTPEVLEPLVIEKPGGMAYRRGTVVVGIGTAAAIAAALEQPFDGRVILHVGATGLTLQRAKEVSAAMTTLESTANTLIPAVDVTVGMSSGLGPALAAYPARARAALAQMSVTVAGVVGVAALVVALMARLLLSRRQSDIALERARGAAVSSVAFRLALESAAFTTLGVVLGYIAASRVVGDVPFTSASLTVVTLVSLVALPAMGSHLARRMWTSRRIPANRQDRAKQARAKGARRLTLEALAVATAFAAVITLQGRGVLQTQSSGIDPFLASAPILLALGITVVVLRIYPIPMAIIQALAKRTRGVAGVITLAKARGRMPLLPLLGLSLAISIAVSGGLLVATVRNGQEQASWERVGGEVRINAFVDDATTSLLEGDGLAVSRIITNSNATVFIGNGSKQGYLLAIDEAYVDAVAAAGITDPADLRALLAAGESASPSEPLPALLSPALGAFAFNDESAVFIGGGYENFAIIGDAITVPTGWATGPFIIVPRDALLARDLEEVVDPTLAFVSGAGAEEAVTRAGVDPATVVTRAGWLAAVSDSALIGGVERMMAMSVVAVGLLATIALLITVLEGVRQRGVALSMLRTQGMSSRYGWWLALTELAPLTIAGVIGGSAAGLAILGLLGRTLGLEVLAGGVAPPPLVADRGFLTAVAAGVLALLLAAVSAEVAAHRRNKLSEVLRLGETR